MWPARMSTRQGEKLQPPFKVLGSSRAAKMPTSPLLDPAASKRSPAPQTPLESNVTTTATSVCGKIAFASQNNRSAPNRNPCGAVQMRQ